MAIDVHPLTSVSAADRTASPPVGVPFVDLSRLHGRLATELQEALGRVLGASDFILGQEVGTFELEFAAYCGVEHCVGVASGTAALTIALLAAGIGPGDEVIVPGHTFIASALAVLHAGATPVFCDVEQATGLIDATSAAAVVSPRTAAIMPVHLYGQVCDMDAVDAVAARHGLFVLEDAAQAHGATWREHRAGSLGAAAAFSFYPSKNLGALGDAGAICTDDAAIAEQARRLRNLGQRAKGDHVRIGFNDRLDGLQAAALRVKLPHLDAVNDARRRLADVYRAGLPAGAVTLPERPDTRSVHHLFPVRLRDRDGAAAFLADAGVSTGVHYFPAAFEHPAFDGVLEPPRVPLPASYAWAREELSLPMFGELEEHELAPVLDACTAWLER